MTATATESAVATQGAVGTVAQVIGYVMRLAKGRK